MLGNDTLTASRAAAAATERLMRAGVPEPGASAEILLSELLDIRRGDIPFHRSPLSRHQNGEYEGMISRRLKREPVQRILGYAYFRNLKLKLNDEALIPRPDTESVVDAALERIDLRGPCRVGPCRVLDIGTGTGAIAISIAQERPVCEVHASDLSETALGLAHRNAQHNEADVSFHLSDLAEGLGDLEGSVDVLVSNPPYIENAILPELAPEVRDWDPVLALDGGRDGLTFYRRIFAETMELLGPEADLVLEVGDGQADSVTRLGERYGLEPLGIRRDLAGSARVVMLRRRA